MIAVCGAVMLLAWAHAAPQVADRRGATWFARWLAVWFLPVGGMLFVILGVLIEATR